MTFYANVLITSVFLNVFKSAAFTCCICLNVYCSHRQEAGGRAEFTATRPPLLPELRGVWETITCLPFGLPCHKKIYIYI